MYTFIFVFLFLNEMLYAIFIDLTYVHNLRTYLKYENYITIKFNICFIMIYLLGYFFDHIFEILNNI